MEIVGKRDFFEVKHGNAVILRFLGMTRRNLIAKTLKILMIFATRAVITLATRKI